MCEGDGVAIRLRLAGAVVQIAHMGRPRSTTKPGASLFEDLLRFKLGPADLIRFPGSGYQQQDVITVLAESKDTWQNDKWYDGFRAEVEAMNVDKENVPRHETAPKQYKALREMAQRDHGLVAVADAAARETAAAASRHKFYATEKGKRSLEACKLSNGSARADKAAKSVAHLPAGHAAHDEVRALRALLASSCKLAWFKLTRSLTHAVVHQEPW
jgi:hypothetical protein